MNTGRGIFCDRCDQQGYQDPDCLRCFPKRDVRDASHSHCYDNQSFHANHLRCCICYKERIPSSTGTVKYGAKEAGKDMEALHGMTVTLRQEIEEVLAHYSGMETSDFKAESAAILSIFQRREEELAVKVGHMRDVYDDDVDVRNDKYRIEGRNKVLVEVVTLIRTNPVI